MTAKGRVAVAMSGGVDSSVAAALCLERGYEVLGLSLRFWPCEAEERSASCCGIEGIASARAVADVLDIPFHVIDCQSVFEAEVLRAAWEEYAGGRTPNPCIHCNSAVKFGFLLERARELGAPKLATGHHARIAATPDGRRELLRGKDAHKDQSYFLFSLTGDQLAASLMPVGEMTKADVRDTARRLGLPSADRAESQDACLHLEGQCFAEVLRRRFEAVPHPGDIVDRGGVVLGAHDGVHRFTIGQRRGLGVATGKRAYVLSIDAEEARVTLSTDPDDLLSPGLVAGDLSWVRTPAAPTGEMTAEVQVRYRHQPAPARVAWDAAGGAIVTFEEPQRAITPGQAVVFYAGQHVLGGGWIERSLV